MAIISEKYQIVIPKGVRNKLSLKIGQEVLMHPLLKQGAILLIPKKRKSRAWYEQLAGLGKEEWKGVDPVDYIKSLREEW